MSQHAVKPIPLISLRYLWREYVQHFPIWFVYASAVGLLHGGLASFPDQGFADLGIERSLFAWTALFPLAWFTVYFVFRIRRSQRIEKPWLAYAWLAFMAAGVPLLLVVGHHEDPLTYDQLSLLFEVAQLLTAILTIGHILLLHGRHALITFFGVTFIYGLLLENTGIVMEFFFEPRFTVYLGPLPAPLCTMVGWSVVFYTTVALTDRFAAWLPWLQAGVWRRAWLATTIALCLDAQLDPLASMSGVFWHWNATLPGAFLGVPAVNFTAWFGAFLPFSFLLFRLRDRTDLTDLQRHGALLFFVPGATLAGGFLCFLTITIIEWSFTGPSMMLLWQFFDRLSGAL